MPQNKKTQAFVVTAMALALAFVLNMFPLFRMPQGGSVTAASMLPIFLVAWLYGPGLGCAAGALLGLLHVFHGDFYFLNPAQFALDYLLAFAVLGISGLFRKKPSWMLGGIAIACMLRTFCHVLAGVIFFAEYAGDVPVWWYSIAYNGPYMAIETAVCVLLFLGIIRVKVLDRLLRL
ncbi:MAG: energy-coupled thiamine transporter ThiT [Clostridia bacterium]|nr:energy-coupled thiamine transporter ThiT [Clostridia bacterium]